MSDFLQTTLSIIKSLMEQVGFENVNDSSVCYVVDVVGSLTSEEPDLKPSYDLLKAIFIMYKRGEVVEDAVGQLQYFVGAMKITNGKNDQFIVSYPEHAEMYARLKAVLAVEEGEGGGLVQPNKELLFDDATWNVYNTCDEARYQVVIVRGDPKKGGKASIKFTEQQLLGMI